VVFILRFYSHTSKNSKTCIFMYMLSSETGYGIIRVCNWGAPVFFNEKNFQRNPTSIPLLRPGRDCIYINHTHSNSIFPNGYEIPPFFSTYQNNSKPCKFQIDGLVPACVGFIPGTPLSTLTPNKRSSVIGFFYGVRCEAGSLDVNFNLRG